MRPVVWTYIVPELGKEPLIAQGPEVEFDTDRLRTDEFVVVVFAFEVPFSAADTFAIVVASALKAERSVRIALI